MYSEDELLPVSALQHLVFCERQWGLIHLERQWAENVLTAEGRLLHERTDAPETESRGDELIVRGLMIRSLRLGLAGAADVVEFNRVRHDAQPDLVSSGDGVRLPGRAGRWLPYPVEYKRGRPKPDRCDEVQLCAQALCLEELLNTTIPEGAIYYGMPRRRSEVLFTEELRKETEGAADRLHRLTDAGITPTVRYTPKCDKCSLMPACLPTVTDGCHLVKAYIASAVHPEPSRR